MLNALETQFKNHLKKFGKSAIINGTKTIDIFTKEYEEGVNSKDFKYLFVPKYNIKQGDIVEIEGTKYFVVHENTDYNSVYDKFTIQRLKHTVKFIINDNLHEFPTIIDVTKQEVSSDTIPIPTGDLVLRLQENELTSKITYDNRFIKTRQAWKVEGFSANEKGILTLYATKDSIKDADDIEQEIPGGLATYTIDITSTVTEVNKGKTTQLTATVYKNDVEDDTQNIIWTSSNDTIATVNGTGLVEGVGIGSVTITATIENRDVTDTITISVVENAEPMVNYGLQGDDSLHWTEVKTYVASKYIDGLEDTSATWTFEITSDTNNVAKIVSTTDTSCDITYDQMERGIFTLTATCSDGKVLTKDIEMLGF